LFPSLVSTKKKVKRNPVPPDHTVSSPLFLHPLFLLVFFFLRKTVPNVVQAKTVTNVVQRVPGRLMAYLLPSDSLIQSVLLSAVPALYSTRHLTALYSTAPPALRTRQRERAREEKGREKERARAQERASESAK
jgi:hypothetical protein